MKIRVNCSPFKELDPIILSLHLTFITYLLVAYHCNSTEVLTQKLWLTIALLFLNLNLISDRASSPTSFITFEPSVICSCMRPGEKKNHFFFLCMCWWCSEGTQLVLIWWFSSCLIYLYFLWLEVALIICCTWQLNDTAFIFSQLAYRVALTTCHTALPGKTSLKASLLLAGADSAGLGGSVDSGRVGLIPTVTLQRVLKHWVSTAANNSTCHCILWYIILVQHPHSEVWCWLSPFIVQFGCLCCN